LSLLPSLKNPNAGRLNLLPRASTAKCVERSLDIYINKQRNPSDREESNAKTSDINLEITPRKDIEKIS
jgi:hypothetical protein